MLKAHHENQTEAKRKMRARNLSCLIVVYFASWFFFHVGSVMAGAGSGVGGAEPLLSEDVLHSRVFAPQVSPDQQWLSFEVQSSSDKTRFSDILTRNLRFWNITQKTVVRLEVPGDPFVRDYHGWLAWRPTSGSVSGALPMFAFVYSTGSRSNHDIYIGWLEKSGAGEGAATVAGFQAKVKKLTDDSGVDYCPVWSPNGDTLLFLSNRGKNRGADAYQVKINQLDQVTPGTETPLIKNAQGVAFPSWSPTNNLIAYTSTIGKEVEQKTGILVQPLTAVNGEYRLHGDVLEVPAAANKNIKIPSWSSDGTLLAYYIGGQLSNDFQHLTASDEEVNDIGVVRTVTAGDAFSFQPVMTGTGQAVLDLKENSYSRGPVWIPGTHLLVFITEGKESENPIIVWDVDHNREVRRITETRVNRDVAAFGASEAQQGVCFTAHFHQVSNIYRLLIPSGNVK